jgi:hypothetical protein
VGGHSDALLAASDKFKSGLDRLIYNGVTDVAGWLPPDWRFCGQLKLLIGNDVAGVAPRLQVTFHLKYLIDNNVTGAAGIRSAKCGMRNSVNA